MLNQYQVWPSNPGRALKQADFLCSCLRGSLTMLHEVQKNQMSLGEYWGYIGIMEKIVETTIMGLYRV